MPKKAGIRKIKAAYEICRLPHYVIESGLIDYLEEWAYDDKEGYALFSLKEPQEKSFWSNYPYLLGVEEWDTKRRLRTYAKENKLTYYLGKLQVEFDRSPVNVFKPSSLLKKRLYEEEAEDASLSDSFQTQEETRGSQKEPPTSDQEFVDKWHTLLREYNLSLKTIMDYTIDVRGLLWTIEFVTRNPILKLYEYRYYKLKAEKEYSSNIFDGAC
jgi:hypothetical protein